MNGSLTKFINNFESYLGAVLFIIMTILLTLQVLTRYVFNYAFTWTEELAVIMFVWLIYLGTSAAVLKRKHLRIDTVLEAVPFKVKKAMLIISNFISLIFCAYIIIPMHTIITNMHNSSAVTPILRLPKALPYIIIPVCMVLTCLRIVQENKRLFKEGEQEFGASQPMLDLGIDDGAFKEMKKQ